MVNYELPSKGQLFSNFDYIQHEDRVSAGEIIFFSLSFVVILFLSHFLRVHLFLFYGIEKTYECFCYMIWKVEYVDSYFFHTLFTHEPACRDMFKTVWI